MYILNVLMFSMILHKTNITGYLRISNQSFYPFSGKVLGMKYWRVLSVATVFYHNKLKVLNLICMSFFFIFVNCYFQVYLTAWRSCSFGR